MRSLHPADAVHKGFGTIPTSILQRKNGVCIYERPACDVDIPVNYCVRNFQITSTLRGYHLRSHHWPTAFSARPLLRLSLRIPLLWFQL